MFWTCLPFGVVVILILGLLATAGALDHQPNLPGPKGVCLVEHPGKSCGCQGKRFAIVDEETPIRFLTREEFELIKRFNPHFLEMKAGDIVYLTKIPQ